MTDVHPFIERVNWDPEHDNPGLKRAVDEIVARNVDIHMERLDTNSVWLSITEHGGNPDDRQVVTFSARGQIVVRTEAE